MAVANGLQSNQNIYKTRLNSNQMANKTTKETNDSGVQTIAAKAAAKVAADIFKKNPDIKEAYITSDGTAFYGRNDAQNHANTLPNREVFGFKRSAISAATTKSTPKPAAKQNAAPAAPEDSPEDEVDELTGETVNNEPENSDE